MKRIWTQFEFGTPGVYTDLGSSPSFVIKLKDWLNSYTGQIHSIDIALYLFNNAELYRILEHHANNGCKINIYSIPLEGYDDHRPVEVVRHTDNVSLGRKTKYDLASELYNTIARSNNPNIHLRIVPHMYLRSKRVRPFSRGNMPYSLHCKTLCVHLKNGTVYAGVTSSNLAVRDVHKHEIAAIAHLDEQEVHSVEDFFEGLYENSVALAHFRTGADYSHFKTVMRKSPPKSRLMFTAPFYEDSSAQFEENICTIIRNAQQRIIVCAQHVSAYDYQYENAYTAPNAKPYTAKRMGFLNEVIKKAKNGIHTEILSQTYADESGSHGCRSPENKLSFIKFAAAAKQSNCRYYVNPYTHCKFVVVDDTVIITSCNLTPTQFIYLSAVLIDDFEHIPGYSYSGVHCEYGVYCVVKNHAFAEIILKYFDNLKQQPDSQRIF